MDTLATGMLREGSPSRLKVPNFSSSPIADRGESRWNTHRHGPSEEGRSQVCPLYFPWSNLSPSVPPPTNAPLLTASEPRCTPALLPFPPSNPFPKLSPRMAISFDQGVILGADSRTTTGAYIANRVTDKLTQVHDTIWCCRSGSAADTQAVADIVHYHLGMYGVTNDEPPTTQTAAALFQELCYDNKDQLR